MPQDSPIGQLSQAMIDSLPQHLALLDQAGRIVAINCSWQKFSSEISGVRLGIGDDYLPACQNLGYEKGLAATGVRAVLAGAEEFKLEYACVGRWGERWFLMQVTPLPRTLGGAVVSHLDITSRKQLETERARWQAEALQTHEAAEVASHAKDEWLAQIMHDLRSPLSAILGWTKVMRSRTLDQDKQAEALAIIEQSAEKQKALIEDLLDLSRIVAGKLRLEVGPVSLSAVMHSAMEVMKPACDAKAVKYDVELATEADAITGDLRGLSK